jgi:hypothetical protein
MFSLNTLIHAVVSAAHALTSRLVASPEFQAFEQAVAPVAETALASLAGKAAGPALGGVVAQTAVEAVESLIAAQADPTPPPPADTLAGQAETLALNAVETIALPAVEQAVGAAA